MNIPSVKPTETYISISNKAGDQYRKIFNVPGLGFDALRAEFMQAFGDVVRPIKDTKELHFAAKIEMPLGPMVVFCVMQDGSPAGNMQHSLVVTGAMSVDEFKTCISGAEGKIGMHVRKAFTRSA
jgi:hypothetical protein